MLPKEYRLPSNTRLVKPHFFRTPLFAVKISQTDLPQNRFAFLVRKTVDKRAVVRNRIRRLLRSCIEELIEQIPSGYDMLFFLEKGIMEKSQKELRLELKAFLKQKGLLKTEVVSQPNTRV